MSIRLAVARHSGLSEDEVATVQRRGESGLDARTDVALRLADRFLSRPADIDDELRAEVFGHFTPAEVVELLCDIAKWSTQKAHVTLRVDDDLSRDGEPIFFDFDDDGEVAWMAPELR
ncbi:MAG: hypothetical protein RIE08_14335 [Acidimicrobiales bacterium]